MMKTLKIIVCLLLILIIDLGISCCPKKRCDEAKYSYTNKSMNVSNIDNSGSDLSVTANKNIIKTAYGIRIQINKELVSCIPFEKTYSVFFQPSYAVDCGHCPPHIVIAKDSIISLKIITLNNFDTTHSANSDISEYFSVYSNYKYSTIANYISSRGASFSSYNKPNDPSQLSSSLDLLLMTPPELNAYYIFKVQMTLSDGRLLEMETPEVNLL